MQVLDFSSDLDHRSSLQRSGPLAFSAARGAARAAGWSGVVLPEAEVLGAPVFPVVEFTGAARRVAAGVGPQRCLMTLEMWETWPSTTVASRSSQMPPAPLRITGFISTRSRWARAVDDLFAVSGAGAGMLVRPGRTTKVQLLEADACDLWVVELPDSEVGDPVVRVTGETGPVGTAHRVPATRLIEEGLFAHALRSGVTP